MICDQPVVQLDISEPVILQALSSYSFDLWIIAQQPGRTKLARSKLAKITLQMFQRFKQSHEYFGEINQKNKTCNDQLKIIPTNQKPTNPRNIKIHCDPPSVDRCKGSLCA